MKKQNPFSLYWLVCSVLSAALLASSSYAAEGMKRGVIVVTGVQGGVLFTKPGDSEPKPLKKGDVLRQGATILAGKGAVADLAFSNG